MVINLLYYVMYIYNDLRYNMRKKMVVYFANMSSIFFFFFFNFVFYKVFSSMNAFFSLYYSMLQFDVFLFMCFLSWVLYMCYLLFYSDKSEYSKVSSMNFWFFMILLSLLVQLIFVGTMYEFFIGKKYFFFNNMYCLDSGSFFMSVWIIFFSIIMTFLMDTFIFYNNYTLMEFPLFFFFGVMTTNIMMAVTDMFLLLILIESLSFMLIAISIVLFSKKNAESSLKYFIQNTLVSGISVFGIFWLYFFSKTTNFFMLKLIVSVLTNHFINLNMMLMCMFIFFWFLIFFFKLGVFPVFYYVPDMYEVSPVISMFFISAVMKPAIFYIFFKIYFLTMSQILFFKYLLSFAGILSMLVGNVLAYNAAKMKSFLGYTSMSQFGFMLMCLVSGAVDLVMLSFVYLFLYNVFLLIVILMLNESTIYSNLTNSNNFLELGNILKENMFFKMLISISILNMSGLPPSIFFIYKYLMFLNLFFNSSMIFVMFMIMLNIISVGYYFSILIDIWVTEVNSDDLKYESMFTFFTNFEFFKIFKNWVFQFLLIMVFTVVLMLVLFFDFLNFYMVLLFIDILN